MKAGELPSETFGQRVAAAHLCSAGPAQIKALADKIDAALAVEAAACAELLTLLPHFTRERAVELLRRRAKQRMPKTRGSK